MRRNRASTVLAANLADNVRRRREALGLSQEELAAQCGLHRTYVGSVERGERNVTLGTLEALSEALGISATELLAAPRNTTRKRVRARG